MCFTNGKGASKESALASALGECIERLSNNHFYGSFWRRGHCQRAIRALPERALVQAGPRDALPRDSLTAAIYDADGELRGSHLIDIIYGGNAERGFARCHVRQSDGETVYFPPQRLKTCTSMA
jgi:ribosomal protein S12 methylthiotransferase accessory factor